MTNNARATQRKAMRRAAHAARQDSRGQQPRPSDQRAARKKALVDARKAAKKAAS